MRLGFGSDLTTSSNTVRSLNRVKLEPRHFKSKEGSVWLNMFETISNNYCLGGTETPNPNDARFNPHRYMLPKDKDRRSTKRASRDLSSVEGGETRSRRRGDL